MSQLKRSCNVVFSDLGEQLVLLDLKSGVYFSLNALGAEIWRLLDAPSDLAAIVSAIVGDYNVEKDRCLEDVRAFVDQLVAGGLVEFECGP